MRHLDDGLKVSVGGEPESSIGKHCSRKILGTAVRSSVLGNQTWVDVQDNAGNQIPLAIYTFGGRVLGRWTLAPGVAPLQRDPMQQFLEDFT